MSDSLKTISLFIGILLIVNELCYQRNFYMKIDYSLGHLKNKESVQNFLKKELSNRIRIFNSKVPYETRTSLFIAFRLLGIQN